MAQIEDGKKYREQYQRMVTAYQQLVKAGSRRNVPSPQEQALLDKQQHFGFEELSASEQQKLKGEIDSMWGQIPAHLQEKARNLAGAS